MFNNISALSTVSECDTVLAKAQTRKSTLQARKTLLENEVNSQSTGQVLNESRLSQAISQINFLTAEIANLPQGNLRLEKEMELKKQEYYKAYYENKLRMNGAVAIVDNDYDIAEIDAKIGVCTALITAVEEHKATLPA